MEKTEIAINWLNNIKYDQFYPLNKAQIEIVNSLKGKFTGDFKLMVTSIGCTKIDNKDNRDNFYINESGKEVPYRHYLDFIIGREDAGMGKQRSERTEQIRIEALREGHIIPKSKYIKNNII